MGISKHKLEKGQTVYWCSCGLSENQPFCDGSHNSVEGFSPIEVHIKETKKYGFCGCKYSENKPFCDGSHRKLPQNSAEWKWCPRTKIILKSCLWTGTKKRIFISKKKKKKVCSEYYQVALFFFLAF